MDVELIRPQREHDILTDVHVLDAGTEEYNHHMTDQRSKADTIVQPLSFAGGQV